MAVTDNQARPPERSPRNVRILLMRNALPVGFVGMIAAFVAFGASNFFTLGNASDVLRLSAPIMVVAIPMAFLLIMGHVDLSVGSSVALSSVVLGQLIISVGLPVPLAVLGGVAAGTCVGALNGFLVTNVRLSPIIVTLGTLTGVRGLAMLLGPDSVYGFGDEFVSIAYSGLFGIPYFVFAAAAVVGIGAFALAKSPVGRHTLAIGVNEEAAFLSGVPVRRTIFSAYLLTGVATGLAGTMYAMLLNSAPSGTLGRGFELDVLTAVMLGGVAFNGGRGTVRGVVLGVLFLAILQNGLTLLNVQAAIASVIKGMALVSAAILDRSTLKAMLSIKGR